MKTTTMKSTATTFKGFGGMLLLLLLAATSVAQAGEQEIRQSLQNNLPGINSIDRISKAPYLGLYEVVIGNQLLYTDAEGRYLIDGSIIDLKTRDNLSELRRRELFAIDFSKLPLDLAVKRVKGNGKRKLAIFEDPQCGFCKKLEKELAQVDDVTLYYFLYPMFKGSDEMVRNTLCSKDPLKTRTELMLNGTRPPAKKCNTRTDEVVALARKLDVNGTPHLIFGDGIQISGFLVAGELEKLLNKSASK